MSELPSHPSVIARGGTVEGGGGLGAVVAGSRGSSGRTVGSRPGGEVSTGRVRRGPRPPPAAAARESGCRAPPEEPRVATPCGGSGARHPPRGSTAVNQNKTDNINLF